jgi:hypothetical protein
MKNKSGFLRWVVILYGNRQPGAYGGIFDYGK